MRKEIFIDGKTFSAGDSNAGAVLDATKRASESRITRDFSDLLEDFIDNITPDIVADAIRNIRIILPEKPKPELTEAIRIILTKYFPDGFNPKLKRDYILFRNHAEAENIPLPPENDALRHAIESEGTNLDGSIFIVSKNLTDTAGHLISDIQDTKASVIFYAPLMAELQAVLTENHIYSREMFRDFLHAKFTTLFYGADSFTFAPIQQEKAVHSDIIRVWGRQEKALYPQDLAARLPYIPPENITECLKLSPDFVRTAEGKYFLMSRFTITPDERRAIQRYVDEACRSQGFTAIVNIPCETVKENNSELTGDGIYTAIFRRVLEGHFHRKHKIITLTESGPNIISIFKNYCRDRYECTVSELEKFALSLTDAVYRAGILGALYDSMIRVSKDKFTADYNVSFDAGNIDRAISIIMDSRRFIPIKGVTSFALFPECGRKWNHYILESFCYRFSRKYELRFYAESKSSIPPFNSSNIGIIAVKGLAMTYIEMLAEILARQDFGITEETAGKFLADAGCIGRAKFSGLREIVRLANERRN